MCLDVEFFVPPGGFHVRARLATLLPKMSRLKVIQSRLAGIDHFDPFAPPEVTICNLRGAHNCSVAEYVVGMVVAHFREFRWYFEAQRLGNAERRETDSISEKTVLILGYGEIGQAIEHALSGFDVTVVRVASRARAGVHGPESLLGLAQGANVLVLTLPLVDTTRNLVDANVLAALPDGALVVNVSRGGVIDQRSLLEQVRAGRLHAVLDTVDPEPLPLHHPLRTTPGIVYTPHIAASVHNWKIPLYRLIGRQLRHYLDGEPLENVVRMGRGQEGA